MKTNFSFHAFARVLARTSLTHQELAHLLDADLVVNIGQESNSNRVHKLFYSDWDKICFVAIQDVKTGTIVTILPVDYHENISWKVSIESQNQAKRLVTKDEVSTNENEVSTNVEILNIKATVFRIAGNLVDNYGRYKKIISLGSWPCLPYGYSIEALVQDKKFVDFLVEKIKEKVSTMNDNSSFLQTIAISLGSSGKPVIFSTSEIIESNA